MEYLNRQLVMYIAVFVTGLVVGAYPKALIIVLAGVLLSLIIFTI